MRLLLQRADVDSNSQCSRDLTPLMFAAEEGHEAVVRLLLNWEDVNPSICTTYDWTALIFAADHGHHAVVELLREQDNVHVESALGNAARKGHEMVVQLLLGQIKPESIDDALRMVLSNARLFGHELAIKRVLGFDGINLDLNRSGLLFQAAEDGNDDAVRVLLNRYNLNPNSRTLHGRTH